MSIAINIFVIIYAFIILGIMFSPTFKQIMCFIFTVLSLVGLSIYFVGELILRLAS